MYTQLPTKKAPRKYNIEFSSQVARFDTAGKSWDLVLAKQLYTTTNRNALETQYFLLEQVHGKRRNGPPELV